MLIYLGFSQVICEPTNFEPGKKPSCIDIIVIDQPNIFLDSGIRASLNQKAKISIRKDVIVSLVRNLNPNKASGSDGISGQMLILSDDSVGMPFMMIFENILVTSLYLDSC